MRGNILQELFRVEDILPFSCVAVLQTSKVGEALAVVVEGVSLRYWYEKSKIES